MKQKVKDASMPNADAYVLMGARSSGCIAGVAQPGFYYGRGVCALNPSFRTSLVWYYPPGYFGSEEGHDEMENDLETALVGSFFTSCKILTYSYITYFLKNFRRLLMRLVIS